MSKLRQTLGGYFWWTYPRGSVPYDIMVTLILAFIFLAPLAINFGDKPTVRAPHQTETVVRPDGNGFLYWLYGNPGAHGTRKFNFGDGQVVNGWHRA